MGVVVRINTEEADVGLSIMVMYDGNGEWFHSQWHLECKLTL